MICRYFANIVVLRCYLDVFQTWWIDCWWFFIQFTNLVFLFFKLYMQIGCFSLSIKLCSWSHRSQIPSWSQSKFTGILQTACVALSFVVVMLWLCKVHCDAGKSLKWCMQIMQWKGVLDFRKYLVWLPGFSVTDSKLPLFLRMGHIQIIIRVCPSFWGIIRIKICQYLKQLTGVWLRFGIIRLWFCYKFIILNYQGTVNSHDFINSSRQWHNNIFSWKFKRNSQCGVNVFTCKLDIFFLIFDFSYGYRF